MKSFAVALLLSIAAAVHAETAPAGIAAAPTKDNEDGNRLRGNRQLTQYYEVHYESVYHGACRTDEYKNGKDGDEYYVYSGYTFEKCHKECSEKDWCQGFEYYAPADRCEHWKEYYPGYYHKKKDFSCFWKMQGDIYHSQAGGN